MKNIDCYGGDYKVSSNGDIYNSKGLCMSQKNDSKGRYKMVNLSFQNKKKMFLVHRLVALAYIPAIKDKTQVNHIDGNKHNNKVENLEWVTQSENLLHSYHVLGKKHKPPMLGKSGKNHNRSRPVVIMSPDNVEYSFGSALEAGRELDIDSSSFVYARKTGLPYTFKKKGKLKGWVLIS